MNEANEPTGYILDIQKPFSYGLTWQLQSELFSRVGIDAWRSSEVPHYFTCNPVMGITYGELALAFSRDLSLQWQIAAIIALALNELVAGRGLPPMWQQGAGLGSVKKQIMAGSRPETIGRQVAGAIWGSLGAEPHTIVPG